MLLRHIERGMRLQIYVKSELNGDSEIYEATFYDLHDLIKEMSFIVQCPKLNRNYVQLDKNAILHIEFASGSDVYAFNGRATSKMYSDMVIIEQLTDIEPLTRRMYQRDEIRIQVQVYGLPEDMINDRRYRSPGIKPLLSDMSFDISSGGMCIISNTILNSQNDRYYLVEFSLSNKDQFLLPAKLVRKSNCVRSRIGKFDYGFQFYFDNMPEEKGRLTKSILSKKLSYIRK